jgi:ABC-type uncharacterized transport system involved in gliding motility auxiliary subunit
MSNKFSSPFIVILLASLFFALVVLNNQLLGSARLDLTENQVYSLSQGSKKILSDIDEPINLYLFFSDKSSKSMTSLRNYASRVESLLQEYNKAANGKINLKIVDPEPFSEAEDQANQFGLTAATIGPAGDPIYLGLAATNALDDQKTIAFFDPQQESFLEYEISKLIYQLSDPTPVKLTVLTDLPVNGGQNPMTGQSEPAWTFYTQLQQLYDVQKIDSSASALPIETDVLLIVHPNNLLESLLFDIDQYAMQGGKLMVFVDPHNESDPMAMMGSAAPNGSKFSRLFEGWGIEFTEDRVLLDAMSGLDIRTANGDVTRHFGFVGLPAQQLDRKDVTTASLEVINGASFGHLSKKKGAPIGWLPLLKSSTNADLIAATDYTATREPADLAALYQSKNTTYVLASRISGRAQSAFEVIPEGATQAELIASTTQLNAIVVADTDLLSDRFWVQQANFFGQTISTPFANNGDFVTNAVENLGGSNALISVRSRGTFARPFTKVEALTVIAEEKFREQEQILQAQLDETENQLAQLQGQAGDSGMLVMSDAQQQAVDDFLEKKIEIRKELRDVRHQLDKDIETLGNWLKFINIAIAPFVLMLILMLMARLLRRKSKPTKGAEK